MRRRRVHSEGEEIGRFGEVGDESSVEKEVDQDEDVHEENQQENDNPAHGDFVAATGPVLLRLDGGVEVLRLGVFEVVASIVLEYG